MKKIVFDAGPIITLTTNNLLWLVEELKKGCPCEFYVPKEVAREIIDKPIRTKKFKFEAMQVEKLVEEKTLEIYHSKTVHDKAQELQDLANAILETKRGPIKIVQLGEMETLTTSMEVEADAVVVDERITRMLIEDPESLAKLMSRRLHTKVRVNTHAMQRFKEKIKGIKFIRSVELVAIAFEKGLLDKYLVHIKQPRKELLESVLWGAKLHGCAVTPKEIDQMVTIITK